MPTTFRTLLSWSPGFYGILKAGAVPVPCNVMYRAEELAYHLNDSGAKILFCEADLYPTAQQVLAETPYQTS